MPINVSDLSVPELENLVNNHRRNNATAKPLYVDALQELEKRKGKGLDFNKSLVIILQAAKERRFLSYKELADGSEADWGQVHYAIGGHLWNLVEYAHRKGWPLLSAIVVNKPNVATGAMEPETLKGFIAAAHDLGIPVTDEVAFLKDEQAKVFAWAQSAAIPAQGEA
jgi:hypothetical protein